MARLKYSRSIIIWAGLIIFGLVMGVQAVFYFQVRQVPVITQDLPAGTQLTPRMVKMVQVNPRDAFLPAMVNSLAEIYKDGNIKGGTGKYTKIPLVAGQPIPKRALTANPLDPEFGIGAGVASGEVAISAAIPIENAVAGLVQVNDVVDVSYSMPAMASTTASTTAGSANRTTLSGTAKTIKDARIIDVRNENGMPRTSGGAAGSAMTSRNLIITFAVPRANAEGFSLAAAGRGAIGISLSSKANGTPAPVPGLGTTPENQ